LNATQIISLKNIFITLIKLYLAHVKNLIMKNEILSVVVLAMTISINAPITFAQNIRFTSDIMLKGKVKKMTEKRFKAKTEMDEVEMDELKHKTIFQFYESGNIKSISYSEYSNDIWYFYNKEGKLTSKYYKNDYSNHKDTIIYRTDGKVEKLIHTKKESDRLIKVQFDYVYNQKGDVISIQKGQGDSYSDISPCLHCREVTKNHLDLNKKFYYQEVELVESNWSGYNTKKVVAEYQYDDQGNWTKCTYFKENNNKLEPTIIITREFSYYPM